jgi:hypothetical protein
MERVRKLTPAARHARDEKRLLLLASFFIAADDILNPQRKQTGTRTTN